MTDIPLEILLLALAVGGVAGVSAGLLGVGGGIVIVPSLYFIFAALDLSADNMHMAVGTSLATIIFTSLRSAQGHLKRGAFDRQLFQQWLFPLLVGAILGAFLANWSSWVVLVALFATVALYVSWQLFRGTEPSPDTEQQTPVWLSRVFGLGVGTFSAMIGIGGGTLAVPLLSALGYPILRAIGTSAAFGFLIALPATIGFVIGGWTATADIPLSLGYVHLPAFLLITLATLVTVPLGVALAHRLPTQVIRRIFSVFLLLTALRMYLDVFNHLTGTAG